MSRKPFTVLVEGNIGCGKTTFLQHFSQFNNVNVLKEPIEKWQNVDGNNLLQLLYEDPKRWSMVFQTYAMLTILENHLNAAQHPITLIERSIFSAQYVFIENLHHRNALHSSELETLSQWFHFITNSPVLNLQVDLIFYLRTQPEKALERIRARSRGEESSIQLSFLQEIHQLHDKWLIDGDFPLPAPVIVIDADVSYDEMKTVYGQYENLILGSERPS